MEQEHILKTKTNSGYGNDKDFVNNGDKITTLKNGQQKLRNIYLSYW